jgi:hypothetical protein
LSKYVLNWMVFPAATMLSNEASLTTANGPASTGYAPVGAALGLLDGVAAGLGDGVGFAVCAHKTNAKTTRTRRSRESTVPPISV